MKSDNITNSCNQLAKEIWEICIASNVWLTAVHIAGEKNIIKDFMSRLQNQNTEWRLSPAIFHKNFRVFYCKPEIDHFASCLNYQIPKYSSWHSDENAVAIDAFSMSWSNLYFYSCPSFSLIGAVLTKIKQEQCSGIMVMPWWKTQVWFPMMVKLLVNFPVLLPPSILTLPWNESM